MSLTWLRILSGDLWTKEQPSASFWCAMELWNGACAVSWKKMRHSCLTSSWIWVWIWKARICLSFVCHARPFRGQRDHVESHFAMTLEQLDSKTFNWQGQNWPQYKKIEIVIFFTNLCLQKSHRKRQRVE